MYCASDKDTFTPTTDVDLRRRRSQCSKSLSNPFQYTALLVHLCYSTVLCCRLQGGAYFGHCTDPGNVNKRHTRTRLTMEPPPKSELMTTTDEVTWRMGKQTRMFWRPIGTEPVEIYEEDLGTPAAIIEASRLMIFFPWRQHVETWYLSTAAYLSFPELPGCYK